MLRDDIGIISDTNISEIEHDFKIYTNNPHFYFDSNRRIVLSALDSIDVNACPGSGKTTMVAAKLLLLSKKWPYAKRGVCALSHTNVAKDEIIKKIKSHPYGQRLLEYPHFIGTIQEFVNRFASLPYLRSQGFSGFHVDNEEYIKRAWRLLDQGHFFWLRGTLNGLGNRENQESFLRETYAVLDSNQFSVHVSSRPRQWRSNANYQKAQTELQRLKRYLSNDGLFLFRDMYTYANVASNQNVNLCKQLQHRFPILFVDEMQDTEQFQDDLIQRFFPLGQNPKYILQRFGDTNQAIFHRYGIEEGNSFPDSRNQIRHNITSSHRFGTNISLLMQALALDKGEGNPPCICNGTTITPYNWKPVLLSFPPGEESQVLDQFVSVISEKLQAEDLSNLNVHAIAASAKKDGDRLRLTSYFPAFNREFRSRRFTSETLYQAVKAHKIRTGMAAASLSILFQDIWQSFIRHLRTQNYQYSDGEQMRYHTVLSLQQTLQSKECHRYGNLLNSFRVLVWRYIGAFESENAWRALNVLLKEMVQVIIGDVDIDAWTIYGELAVEGRAGVADVPNPNIYERNGIKICINTIHGVKGQTHDATLVMETFFRNLDWKSSAEGMHLSRRPRTTPKTRHIHMRGLFVGCSRPSKLLCIGVTQETATYLQTQFPDFFEIYTPQRIVIGSAN